MGRKSQRTLLEFVDHLYSQAGQVLGDVGLPPETARQAAAEISKRLLAVYAKTILYIPENIREQLDERDRLIWAKYGQPGPDDARPYSAQRLEQVAREYGLSVVQLYNIVRLQHRLQMADRQGVLPGVEDG